MDKELRARAAEAAAADDGKPTKSADFHVHRERTLRRLEEERKQEEERERRRQITIRRLQQEKEEEEEAKKKKQAQARAEKEARRTKKKKPEVQPVPPRSVCAAHWVCAHCRGLNPWTASTPAAGTFKCRICSNRAVVTDEEAAAAVADGALRVC